MRSSYLLEMQLMLTSSDNLKFGQEKRTAKARQKVYPSAKKLRGK